MNEELPRECRTALEKLYEFHDRELTEERADEIRSHLLACEPCLDTFDVEAAIRLLVRRCCSGQQAPESLRLKIRTEVRRTIIIDQG